MKSITANHIKNFVSKIIILITTIFTTICFFLSLFTINSRAVYLNEHKVQSFITIILGTILLFFVILFLFKFINKLNSFGLKLTLIVLLGLFILIELFVAFNLTANPMTDSYKCIDAAYGFANGNISEINSTTMYYNYFSCYSNNNLFVMILTYFFKLLNFFSIKDLIFSSIILNALLIFIAVLFTFGTSYLLFGLKNSIKALALIILNPTLYLFVPWIYTCTFSLPFMMGIIFFGVLTEKCKSYPKRILCVLAMAVLSAIGFLIRPTALFPAFALIVFLIINFKLNKIFIKKAIILSITFLLVFSAVFIPLKQFSNKKFEKTLDSNFPLTHWMMMASHGNATFNEEDSAFTQSYKTKKERIVANLEQTKINYSQYNLLELNQFALKKIYYTWADGTNNYLGRTNQCREFSPAYDYLQGYNNSYIILYCQIFRALSFFLLIYLGIKLIKSKHCYNNKLLILFTTLLGGFFFYLIWEVKSEYSLPFTLILIVLMSYSANAFSNKIILIHKRKSNIIISSILLFAMFLTITFGYLNYNEVTEKEMIKQDYSVMVGTKKTSKILNNLKNNKSITQTFYTKKQFNYISICVFKKPGINNNNLNKSIYKISLLNSLGKTVFSQKLTGLSILQKSNNSHFFNIKLNEISPKNNEKYTLKIKLISDVNDTLNWYAKNTLGTDIYKGDLFLSDKKQNGDLIIRVAQEKTEPLNSKLIYFSIILSLVFLELSLLIMTPYKTIKTNKKRD